MQISTDSRNPWERMRRRELWELGTSWGVPYPSGATKDQMIQILSANGVNPLDPKGAFEFDEVQGEDETGRPIINRYPRRKLHATANKDIDYAQIMESKTKTEDENKSLKDEVAELKAMVEKLTTAQPTDEPRETSETTQPLNILQNTPVIIEDLKFHEMKRLAKERGLTIPNTMKKPELIERLKSLG